MCFSSVLRRFVNDRHHSFTCSSFGNSSRTEKISNFQPNGKDKHFFFFFVRFIESSGQCLIVATVLGLMMISIGICAAFWEDKLRRTPASIRRGYFLDENQVLFGQSTHPRPGAAAAAAVRCFFL